MLLLITKPWRSSQPFPAKANFKVSSKRLLRRGGVPIPFSKFWSIHLIAHLSIHLFVQFPLRTTFRDFWTKICTLIWPMQHFIDLLLIVPILTKLKLTKTLFCIGIICLNLVFKSFKSNSINAQCFQFCHSNNFLHISYNYIIKIRIWIHLWLYRSRIEIPIQPQFW